MNLRFPVAVISMLFAFGAISPVHAGTKVLEYDKSGKAKVRSQDFKNKKKAGRGQQMLFTKDPTDPINQFVAGELVVLNPPSGFSDGVTGMGYRILEGSNLDGLDLTMYRLQIPKGHSVPEAKRELSRRFPGAVIDANHRFESQASKKPRKIMHARGAMGWALAPASCGHNIKLGQIDSGVDLTHAALKGQRVKFRSFHSKGTRPGPKIHGTAVAAMLVGRPKWGGLLPGAQLMAASMFQTAKDGRKVGTALGLLKSLNWLAKARVHAINLSVAGTDNKTLRLAFDKARKIGLVLVAAAGNWGRGDRPAYPAAYKHVIAVTAVSTKRKIYSYANTGDYIDFAAPGVKIYAAVPGGAKMMSGTSFASPYITAMVGSDVAAGASRRDAALRKALSKRTDDLGARGKDSTFGFGFVKKRPSCGP
jgi:subtilisin family serine protease